MAEEKMMRLSQAAKKLNVGIAKVIEILGSAGHRIDNNPNAKLAYDQLEILAKELDSPDLLGGETSAPAASTESRDKSDSEILYFREEPKSEEPEIVKIETTIPGPKVLGKIDLNARGEVKIQPIAEPEPEEEKAPEPVVEKVPEPVVEEKKPEPVVEKVPEPVVEEKKPEPEPVVEKVPEPVVEEKKPEPVIEKAPEPVVVKKRGTSET